MASKQRITRQLSGRGISPGLALGNAFVYRDILYRDQEQYEIVEAEIEGEHARFDTALQDVLGELKLAATRIEQDSDEGLADIFRSHGAMLSDPALHGDIKREIEIELINPEQAVKRVFRRWERKFLAMEDERLSQRSDDIADLARRLLRSLAGVEAHTLENMPAGSILVARRLLPSDTVFLNRRSTAGVVVELGGPLSHAAVLTRELGVPAVSQVSDVLSYVLPGDTLLVDGTDGGIILNPDQDTEDDFRAKVARQRTARIISRDRAHTPAKTRDGLTVEVLANVGCDEDVERAAENGADGIGLYRIEHIYLSRQTPPSEQELLDRLRRSLQAAKDKTVTIRLLDAGGDKELPFVNLRVGPNPFLGRRGVRLLFDYPELMAVQFRALLRLTEYHDVHVLVPMITLSEEMARTRKLFEDTAREIGIKPLAPLGAMIETPAAALCTREIVKHADFLSIGTNDLTQYTMAAGRENPLVSDYFIDDHPAMRRLLRMIRTDTGNVPVSICGELASRKEGVRIAIECGIRCLSVSPPLIPGVKDAIRETCVGEHDTIQDPRTGQSN